ncbi:MAG: SusD/RagB family nutrient-binding outer membrane lipoprotein [Bacteroidales bacterium]
MHLSKRDNGAFTEALSYLNNAISSNDENMMYYYNTNDYTNGNPAWLFQEDRAGDAVMGYFFVEKLKELGDPRLPQYVSPLEDTLVYNDITYLPGDYFGCPAGEPINGSSLPGPAIAASNTPTPIITFAEVLFIKAECEFQTGVAEAAVKATLKAAVAASLAQYGVMDQAWLDNLETTWGSGADLFKEIMMQKYLALGYQTETFVDFRRTDNVIGLTPNPESSSSVFPRRYPYATDPVTYNPNTPSGVDIFQKVWWDN